MEKIKPVVIGYRRVSYGGRPVTPKAIWSKQDIEFLSGDDLLHTEVKSKFRPVYTPNQP